MTRDDIIRMAREAGLFVPQAGIPDGGALMRFVAAVEAAEREACAKVCEDTDIVDFQHCMVLHQDAAKTLTNAAAAIRARSNT